MIKLIRISSEDIEAAVIKDLSKKSSNSIEKLKKFYYNILIEPNIRTSSFRYSHARYSLIGICEHTADSDTIDSLKSFHRNKVQFEIDNPVTKEVIITKANPATRADRFGDRSAGQVNF